MNRTSRQWINLPLLAVSTLAGCIVLCLAGCNNWHRSDRQIQQQAAQTTEQAKQAAEQAREAAQRAAADARIAAANAERKVNDITAGVKQGMNGNGSPGAIDINTAGERRLTTLPGITPERARRIIGNRPYDTPHDLVPKGVLTRAEYDQISGQIIAGHG
jgi:DNA uptake protein ComE-like DNA-binding protein